MTLQNEDIIRVANSLIADYGEEAETEAKRRVANSVKNNGSFSAYLWREVKAEIKKRAKT